jgi:hypothetical protein
MPAQWNGVARNKKGSKKNARECRIAEMKQAGWEGEVSAWNAVSSKKRSHAEYVSAFTSIRDNSE